MKRATASLIAAIVLSATGAAPAGSQEYELIDIGTLGGNISVAYSITEGGIIAGAAQDASSALHPVLWIDHSILDMGPPPGFYSGEAVAANDSGQAVVVAEGSPQSYTGYLWEDYSWTDLGVLPDREECIPEDIDSSGRIVGSCLTLGSGNAAAFIWESGEMTDLGTLSGAARAYGINDAGQVVGHCRATQPGGNGEQRGFLWENGSMTELPPLRGRYNSKAYGVSESGDVAGSSWYPTGPYSLTVDRATVWTTDGDTLDLDYTPGPPVCSANPYYPDNVALAVNDHGQAVGHAQCIASGGSLAAFLWDNGTMHNLNDLVPPGSGWDLIKATDINNAGEIVGFGLAPGGGSYLRAFLLVPAASSVEDEEDTAGGPGLALSCHPSPFGPRTNISFALDSGQHARVAIYDLGGREIAVITDQHHDAGDQSVVWNGRSEDGYAVPSGIYFARLSTEHGTGTAKLTLLR